MTWTFAGFLALHGAIHLLGVLKAFGYASLPQLTRPISPAFGIVWLIAAGLFVAAAAALVVWPRWWWTLGAVAIAVSTVAIVPAWTDAKFGALGNTIALAGVIFGFLTFGPRSLRAEYEHDRDRLLAVSSAAQQVAEADLKRLPGPVQQYLRLAGAVGQPRVKNFRVAMHGRIRSSPDARWMPFASEQYNRVDEPARLFYMTASMLMIPAQGYHRFVGPSATMRIKAAGAVSVVDVAGPEMNQSETVTLFNDMCIFAPATLIDPSIVWEEVDRHRLRATFSNAGQTVRAELAFNERGELTNFWSDDRYQLSADGKSATKVRWSTPVGGYRQTAVGRLASHGEGRWHEPDREFAYIELTIDEVQYNAAARRPDSPQSSEVASPRRRAE